MSERGEADDWVVDRAVAEYEAYCRGELSLLASAIPAIDGEVRYCGTMDDGEHWTVGYVRADDEAVTPLAVGEFNRVVRTFRRLDELGAEIWDKHLFPPPLVVVGGARHHFRAAQGRFLVGVVKLGRRAVLLAALGERLAVIHLEGRSRAILHVGPPLGLREIDVDTMLRFHRPGPEARPRPAPDAAARPSPETEAHHVRIVYGTPVVAGRGPSVSDVLWECFEDLARRATASRERASGQKLRGKTIVLRLLRYAQARADRLRRPRGARRRDHREDPGAHSGLRYRRRSDGRRAPPAARGRDLPDRAPEQTDMAHSPRRPRRSRIRAPQAPVQGDRRAIPLQRGAPGFDACAEHDVGGTVGTAGNSGRE